MRGDKLEQNPAQYVFNYKSVENLENAQIKTRRILHLTLKKKWFDFIKTGEKKLEYREDKPYWRKRLLDDKGFPKMFDIVRFRNGYAKNSPVVDVEFKSILCLNKRWLEPQHGEVLPENVFAIHLGKVLNADSINRD